MKILSRCLVLSLVWVTVAYAQTPAYINGTIKNARPVALGQKSVIILSLQGRSETYLVRTADAPKFGLLKAETAAAAPDADRMAEELAAVQGWKVKLGIEAAGNYNKHEFRVNSLERLPGK